MFSNLDALNTKISILGLDIESSKNTADKSRLHLHNFILQSLIEFGLLGLLFQMWLITKLYAAKGKIAIVTTVGVVAGLFTSVFYLQSSLFVLIYMYFLNQNKRKS